MNKPTVGAQLFTIREFTRTPEDIAASMKKIKQIGYNAVQVSGFGPITHQQVKDIMDAEGLIICATHVSYDRLKNDIEDVIEQTSSGTVSMWVWCHACRVCKERRGLCKVCQRSIRDCTDSGG